MTEARQSLKGRYGEGPTRGGPRMTPGRLAPFLPAARTRGSISPIAPNLSLWAAAAALGVLPC